MSCGGACVRWVSALCAVCVRAGCVACGCVAVVVAGWSGFRAPLVLLLLCSPSVLPLSVLLLSSSPAAKDSYGCHLLGRRRAHRRCPAHRRRHRHRHHPAVPQGRAGQGADHLQDQEGRRDLHRCRRPARPPQGRDDGHLGEEDRDPPRRARGADLPGQHPRRHPDHLLRPGQQDRRGRHQGRPVHRYAAGERQGRHPGVLRREVLRGPQDRRQAARLRRPVHQARGVPGQDHPGHRDRPERLPPRRRRDRLP
ncbi:hypothetical protein SCYAM73S_02109 [Streptomyces cyaneofuscatus]